MKLKSYECHKSIRNYIKKKTWNVRRLVNESFVPSAHQTNVLYWRLTVFYPGSPGQGLLVCLTWPARSIIGIYRERIFPLFSSKPIKMFMQYDDVGVLKSWTGQKGKWGLHHLSSQQSHWIKVLWWTISISGMQCVLLIIIVPCRHSIGKCTLVIKSRV